MSETKDSEESVKSLGGSYHETLEAQIAFLRAKHYLNFPTMGVVFKNRYVIQGKIRAQENAESLGISKGSLWKGQQHDSVGNFVQGTLIAMHPILVAVHRYRVKLTGREGAGVIQGGEGE